ncbi:MAG: metallophosphoesterase, partial [Legionellales bacterium]
PYVNVGAGYWGCDYITAHLGYTRSSLMCWRLQVKGLLKSLVLALCCVSTCFAHIRFLTVSDIHYGVKNSSNDGSDTGDTLLILSLNKIKSLSKEVDFMLYLGDLPTHLFGYSPKKGGYEQTLFQGLFQADALKKPMFYVSGNNDPLGGDYQPFKSHGETPLKYAKKWNGACVRCSGLILDDTHMRSGGYYSSYVQPKNKEVLLIVLNTTQWMLPHIFIPAYPNQDKDARRQLDWLESQLSRHHAKQVLIAMHEPPGTDFVGFPFWYETYLRAFIGILDANKKNYGAITLLTSHTHMDEIRKIKVPSGSSIYAFSTPSVSRIFHNNSAVKVFDLDNQMRVKDFTTYYTTNNESWGDLQYQALGSKNSIFPHCQNKTLPQCLNGLSDEKVCDYIEQGLFYGVKSPRVNNASCRLIYKVLV